MNKLDFALAYAARGWHVFPIHTIKDGVCTCGRPNCKSPAKHPIFKDGFKTATTDPELIKAWWLMYEYNIGIVTGKQSGIWVIDVDADKGGFESFEDIDPAGESECFTTSTGGGGNHYIWKYPTQDGLTVPSRVNVLNGIDIRGDGGYIVAPPSNHESGHCYEWLTGYSPFDDDPEDLFVEFPLHRANDFGFFRDVVTADQNSWATVEAWNIDEEELRKIKCALFVMDFDDRDHWVRAGMALHSMQWDQAFNLWCEWASGSDKFDYNDSRRVWASFSNKGNGANVGSLYHFANSIDPDFFDPEPLTFVMDDELFQQTEAHKNAAVDIPVYKYGDKIMNPPAKPISLWGDGAMSEGTITLIVAPPKMRKSFMFMSMSMAASCGGKFLGYEFIRPLKVLWLQAELQDCYIFERLQQVDKPYSREQKEMIYENFEYTPRVSLKLEELGDINKLRRIIDKHNPDLLCIDPFFNFTLGEENSASELRKALLNIASLRDGKNPNLAIAIIHHTKKEIIDGEIFDAIRGSGAFRGFYDLGIGMLRQDDGYLFKFECRNRSEMPDLLVNYDQETGEWNESEFIDDRLIPEANSKYDPFFRFLNEHDQVSSKDCKTFLENNLGINNAGSSAVLTNLKRQGWIVNKKEGNISFWALYSKFNGV